MSLNRRTFVSRILGAVGLARFAPVAVAAPVVSQTGTGTLTFDPVPRFIGDPVDVTTFDELCNWLDKNAPTAAEEAAMRAAALCPFEFGGSACGADRSKHSDCGRTFADCRARGNADRFGGDCGKVLSDG